MTRRRKTINAPLPGVDYHRRQQGRGRPCKDMRRIMKILMTVDYRGVDDDELCFMFRGADMELLRRVFDFLVAGKPNGNGIARDYRIEHYYEQGIVHRERDHLLMPSSRIIVTPVEPNLRLVSVEDMVLLIEQRLRAEWPVVFWYEKDVNRWLNMYEMPRQALQAAQVP